MNDERKIRTFLEPPMDPRNLPEQTRQNIAKLETLFDFQSTVIDQNIEPDTGLLYGDVDWSREIEKFNQGSDGPEISIDDVIRNLQKTRASEEAVEQNSRIAGQLKNWLQRNQE